MCGKSAGLGLKRDQAICNKIKELRSGTTEIISLAGI